MPALIDAGYGMERLPGRGRANNWLISRNGRERRACLRTAADRWIAFPPTGTGWKTLDEVDIVIIATVDRVENPQAIEIYLLGADEVRSHFQAAYKARQAAGQRLTKNFGMWVALDLLENEDVRHAGSGILAGHEPAARLSLAELDGADEAIAGADVAGRPRDQIVRILDAARGAVAEITGLPVDKVRLSLSLDL
ncbi:hypothetical protein [Afifella sp. IM 167]|uniref:hypothetical protein n=1 Tax=Afifella sp. IM 167 TaxID=2033586 RepID=UPI001CCBC682|nr:hypothetical protein [Afifella sp. IM 167]MBZ8132658.1 hypothetical protein [Afifella sp. IM 167]